MATSEIPSHAVNPDLDKPEFSHEENAIPNPPPVTTIENPESSTIEPKPEELKTTWEEEAPTLPPNPSTQKEIETSLTEASETPLPNQTTKPQNKEEEEEKESVPQKDEANISNKIDDSKEFKIPKTGKAGCVVNPGPNFTVEVIDVEVPEPGPDEILLKLNATGICYSDLHYMMEDLAMPKMTQFGVRSPGHEGAGIVVKVGSNVTTWKVGDRGGVKPIWDCCMNCELCWDGFHETYCSKTISTGLMHAGTYQQYITSPARYTTRIPDGVDDFTAGPIMCSGSTIYRSIIESQLKAGDWAVFPGAGGGVGHMGVQIAKAMGMRVIGIDGGPEKEALCKKLGCEEFIDFLTTKKVEEEVLRITGGKGAHGVFVTATSAAAYGSAPYMVRVGGKVMCIGLPPSGTAIAGADPAWFIFKNLHIIGTMVGSMRDTDAALDLAARGLLKPIYEKYPIARLPEAVEKLRKGQVAGRGVVDFNE